MDGWIDKWMDGWMMDSSQSQNKMSSGTNQGVHNLLEQLSDTTICLNHTAGHELFFSHSCYPDVFLHHFCKYSIFWVFCLFVCFDFI